MKAGKPPDQDFEKRIKEDSIPREEHQLWRDFRGGDMAAYAVFYKKFFFALYNYGKKICPDHELVKDSVQDLFLKIWNNRENLSDTTSVKYYLFTSLKRKLLDNLDTSRVKNRVDDNIADLMLPADDFLVEGDEDERKQKILQALSTLSQHQQRLIHMKFNEDRSNKEIAEELGITIQSVYNAVFKTLSSIRKQLLFWCVMMSFLG